MAATGFHTADELNALLPGTLPGLVGVVVDTHETGRLTSHLDVAPTLIELAGGDPPHHLMGQSFLTTLRDASRTNPTRELVLEKSHHDRYDPIRAIRTDRVKYIRNFRPGPQVPLALELAESPTRRRMDHLVPPKPTD